MGNKRLPGRTFILASSIILLVGTAFNVITAIPMLISSAYWDATLPIFIPWSYWYIFVLVSSMYTLYLCINGIKFCNVPEKSDFLFTLGIFSLVIAILVLGFNFVALGIRIMGFAGLTMPILYLVGAKLNVRYYEKGEHVRSV